MAIFSNWDWKWGDIFSPIIKLYGIYSKLKRKICVGENDNLLQLNTYLTWEIYRVYLCIYDFRI